MPVTRSHRLPLNLLNLNLLQFLKYFLFFYITLCKKRYCLLHLLSNDYLLYGKIFFFI